MKTIIQNLAFSFLLITASACSGTNIEKEKQSLMETDREFSKLSERAGTAEAFDFYMADSAVLLHNFSPPIAGRDNIRRVLANGSRAAVLKWEPYFADVAKSGDLGYTLGSYELTMPDTTGKEITRRGYYITVWKKQSDGSWKYVFDTGNQLK